MSNTLVAYFSTAGTTKKVAEKIGMVLDADLFEIIPFQPYTKADLDWRDKNSRSTIEMTNKTMRPAIGNKVADMASYDTVVIGFPIWWYVAPTIINTFLESYDMKGKKIALFATSGGSDMGNSMRELKPSAPDSTFIGEKRFKPNVTAEEITGWLRSIGL